MSEGPCQRGTLCVAIFAGARCGTVFVRARLLVRAFCRNLEGDTVGLARGVDSRRRACSLVRRPELDARRPFDPAPVTMCHMMGVMRAAAPAVVDALSCSGTHAHAGGGDDDGQQILDGAPYDETCRQMPSEHIAKQVGKADFGAACSTWQRNSVNEQLDHGAGGEADQQVASRPNERRTK